MRHLRLGAVHFFGWRHGLVLQLYQRKIFVFVRALHRGWAHFVPELRCRALLAVGGKSSVHLVRGWLLRSYCQLVDMYGMHQRLRCCWGHIVCGFELSSGNLLPKHHVRLPSVFNRDLFCRRINRVQHVDELHQPQSYEHHIWRPL